MIWSLTFEFFAGQIVGITNLGYTCFLNSLLQALASCPTFVFWLQKQNEDKKSCFAKTLLTELTSNYISLFQNKKCSKKLYIFFSFQYFIFFTTFYNLTYHFCRNKWILRRSIRRRCSNRHHLVTGAVMEFRSRSPGHARAFSRSTRSVAGRTPTCEQSKKRNINK